MFKYKSTLDRGGTLDETTQPATRRRLPTPVFPGLLVSVVLTCSWQSAVAQDAGGSVSGGGTSRYVSNRWGLVEGSFSNRTDQPVKLTAVVTPPNSNGLQYGRRVEVPPQSLRSVRWPMRMPLAKKGLQEVEFLIFNDGDEDGTIKRRSSQDLIRSFTMNLRLTDYGHAGMIAAPGRPNEHVTTLQRLLAVLLGNSKRQQIIVPVKPPEIGGSAHALDVLDQLCVTTTTLDQYPETCDAIREWVQRGGSLMIPVDQTGIAVARRLLGDALPLTHVNTTSANSITLKLNPEYSPMRFPTREVERSFPEPVDFMRVIAGAGEVIWSIDGWPAAITCEYGRGRILVTTVAPAAFVQLGPDSDAMIPSSSRFADVLIPNRNIPLLSREQAVETATQQIGYTIPSRGFAVGVVLGFPLLLLACGLFLRRQQRLERLFWVVPAIAIVACLPPAVKGWSSRNVAPQTVIQQQVVRAIEGETRLVSDGFVTLYTPESGAVAIKCEQQSIFLPEADPDNRDYRRLMWTSDSDCEWLNMKPPVGMRTGQARQVLSLATPLRATATFSKSGVIGELDTSQFRDPTDAVLAGLSPDRQAVAIDGNEWSSSGTDLLSPNQYFASTLLTEEQLHHTAVYRSIFAGTSAAFPAELSLLYWADGGASPIAIGDSNTRHSSSVLVVQPVTLIPPTPGEPITIPPVLLPYRAVVDAEGGLGTLYSNSQRRWSERERGGHVNLAFNVPDVCLPMDVSEASMELKITAGSRKVEILAGPRFAPKVIKSFNSLVGSRKIKLPVTALARGNKVHVQIRVSDANVVREEGVEESDQDDPWKIERVLLTIKGSRSAE